MLLLLGALGTTALAADQGPPPPPPIVVSSTLGLRSDGPPALPPVGSASLDWNRQRLLRARTLRNVGVGLSFGGLGAVVTGSFLALAGSINEDPPLLLTGAGTVLVGGVAMLAGPPVTLAGGYTARTVIDELGLRPRSYGLDVLAWGAYGLSFVTGVTWFGAAGLSWAYANVTIHQAERALYEPTSAAPRVYVRAVPTYDVHTRQAGLRVDVAF